MLKTAYSLLLSPKGRIGRAPFGIGVLFLCALWALQHFVIYPMLGTGMANFYIAPILFFLGLHIIYCVCGKRLHDLGRSNWALIGVFCLLFTVMMIVILKFGGLEYFDTIMQNPEKQDDPEFMRQVHATYQDNLAKNLPQSSFLMSIVPALFALWLLLAPGQTGDNRYGNPPST